MISMHYPDQVNNIIAVKIAIHKTYEMEPISIASFCQAIWLRLVTPVGRVVFGTRLANC